MDLHEMEAELRNDISGYEREIAHHQQLRKEANEKIKVARANMETSQRLLRAMVPRVKKTETDPSEAPPAFRPI